MTANNNILNALFVNIYEVSAIIKDNKFINTIPIIFYKNF